MTPPAMNGFHNFLDQARDTDDTRDVSSNLSKKMTRVRKNSAYRYLIIDSLVYSARGYIPSYIK